MVLPRYVKPVKLAISTNYFRINGNYSYSHFFKTQFLGAFSMFSLLFSLHLGLSYSFKKSFLHFIAFKISFSVTLLFYYYRTNKFFNRDFTISLTILRPDHHCMLFFHSLIAYIIIGFLYCYNNTFKT